LGAKREASKVRKELGNAGEEKSRMERMRLSEVSGKLFSLCNCRKGAKWGVELPALSQMSRCRLKKGVNFRDENYGRGA